MGFHQLVGGSTGPGFSQLHFDWLKMIMRLKEPSFDAGFVIQSNNVFTSGGRLTVFNS